MAIGDNMLITDVFAISEFQTAHSILVPIQPDSIEDAKLIVDIRSRKKGSFLKETSDNHVEQIIFLNSYRLRNIQHDEIYFKVFDKKKNKFNGLVRITDLKNGQIFNWQSFVCKVDCSPQLPIDVMFSIYQIGFDVFDKQLCGSFSVDHRSENIRKLHKVFGMVEIVGKDTNYVWYEIKKHRYENKKYFFQKLGYGLSEVSLNIVRQNN